MGKDKILPIGICDRCGGPIKPDEFYTRRGPRRYCSVDCKNTANSRSGAPERSRKAKQRVAAGIWYNPRSEMTPERISAVQSSASRKARLKEVAENRWKNPAITDEARVKLSLPRKFRGALHSAIQKRNRGIRMPEMTSEERSQLREHQRKLRERYTNDMAFVVWLRGLRDLCDLRVTQKHIGIREDLWPRDYTRAIIAYDSDESRIGIIPSKSEDEGIYFVWRNGRRILMTAQKMVEHYDIECGPWKFVGKNDDGFLIFEKDHSWVGGNE